jgi:hypothetical protein
MSLLMRILRLIGSLLCFVGLAAGSWLVLYLALLVTTQGELGDWHYWLATGALLLAIPETYILAPIVLRRFERWLELKAQLQELEGLAGPGNSQLDLRAALDRFGEQVSKVFEVYCDHNVVVTVKVLDPDQPEFLKTIFVGHKPKGRITSEPPRFRVEGSVTGWIVKTGTEVVIPSVDLAAQAINVDPNTWPDRSKFVKSAVGAPVFLDRDCTAVLVIDSAIEGAFPGTAATLALAKKCAEVLSGLLKVKGVQLAEPVLTLPAMGPIRPGPYALRRQQIAQSVILHACPPLARAA